VWIVCFALGFDHVGLRAHPESAKITIRILSPTPIRGWRWHAKKNPSFTQQNDEQVKEEYRVKFSESFVALENLHEHGDIEMAWESISKSSKISAGDDGVAWNELHQHKSQFDEEMFKVFGPKKASQTAIVTRSQRN